MTISIKLDVFEGPLDLLLHLIRKAEVDIYDIPIAEITDQYISYLKAMEELDLDIASEFLVMAATLIEIKSRMLLPKKASTDDELSADEDPRVELVEKLVEYKKYKEFAGVLKEIESSNAIFFKSPEILDI
jgi:segregation and condensation protein A